MYLILWEGAHKGWIQTDDRKNADRIFDTKANLKIPVMLLVFIPCSSEGPFTIGRSSGMLFPSAVVSLPDPLAGTCTGENRTPEEIELDNQRETLQQEQARRAYEANAQDRLVPRYTGQQGTMKTSALPSYRVKSPPA